MDRNIKLLIFLGCIIAIVLLVIGRANAETWIPSYGFFENSNEISAKTEAIPSFDNIYDFNTSPNAGGESIADGKYYVPIMYNGGYNGTDTDYVYLNDLLAKDGVNGTNGVNGINGTNGMNGTNGAKGDKGDTGPQGLTGAMGPQGHVGENGKDGVDGKDGLKGEQGVAGTEGKTGKEGRAVAPLTAPQEAQYKPNDRMELIGEVVVGSTRRSEFSVYAGRDFGNDNNIVGAKVKFWLFQSAEQKRMDELEARLNKLDNLEAKLPSNSAEVYATSTGLGMRETRSF